MYDDYEKRWEEEATKHQINHKAFFFFLRTDRHEINYGELEKHTTVNH